MTDDHGFTTYIVSGFFLPCEIAMELTAKYTDDEQS